MLDSEEWRPVLGYEGLYEVSNQGRVRALQAVKGYKAGRLRKITQNQYGYQYVPLSKNGKARNHFLHVLVAEAFWGPKPAGLVVNHKNGVKTDCRLENLEFVTPRENCLHRSRVLGKCRGEAHYKARFTDQELEMMRQMARQGIPQRRIAACFNTRQSYVSAVVNNQTRCPEGGVAVFKGRCKLTELQVRQIKVALAQGGSPHHLAAQYHVHPATIWKIHEGVRWAHVQIAPSEIASSA